MRFASIGRAGMGNPLVVILALMGLALLTTLMVDMSNRRSRAGMRHVFEADHALFIARASVEESIRSAGGQAVLLERITAALAGRPGLTSYPKTHAYFVTLLDPVRTDPLMYVSEGEAAASGNKVTSYLRLVPGPPNTVEFHDLPAGEYDPAGLKQAFSEDLSSGKLDISLVEIRPLLYVQKESAKFSGGVQGRGIVRATGRVTVHGQGPRIRRRLTGEYAFELKLEATVNPPVWRATADEYPWRIESVDES